MLNLDTNILLFQLEGRLTGREADLVRNNNGGISAMVLWELAKLHQLGRIGLAPEGAEMRRIRSELVLWPVDEQVCAMLSRLDFSSDPADELIAATSPAHRIPLLTRDQKMLASRVVPLAR